MSYIINNRKKNKRDKKGNLTVLLIGVITVMLLMTTAMSKRMSAHTRLLTLSDYTQISRYFLESYVSEVMQCIRFASMHPDSGLLDAIKNNTSDLKSALKGNYKYDPSQELKDLAKYYNPNIIEFCTNELPLKITLSQDTKPIGYNNVVTPGPDRENDEKEGSILISCECKFQKRKYKMEVTYPFSVVYRMTPILKDFMLFVDNIKADQNYKNKKDYLNVLQIDEYNIASNQDLRESNHEPIKPFVLMQPLDQNEWNNKKITGNIYLGGSNYNNNNESSPVYLNLAGGKQGSAYLETYMVQGNDLRLKDSSETDGKNGVLAKLKNQIFLYAKINNDYKPIYLPNVELPLAYSASAKMSIMGFSLYAKEAFEGAYGTKDFLLPESAVEDSINVNWSNVRVNFNSNESELGKSLTYASALKLFGINPVNQPDYNYIPFLSRELYGNIFARYIIYTFWQPNGTAGLPLNCNLSREISDIPEQKMWNSRVTRKFTLTEENNDYYNPSDVNYKFFMSKIVSGFDYDNPTTKFKNIKEEDKKLFFMYMNLDDSNEHKPYNERDFTANDTSKINTKFYNYWKSWFVDKDSSDNRSPIEKRIGRAYDDQKEFKEAVGYNNEPKNFNINGVVYVDGDLTIEDDLNLNQNECSGGIVLVNGNIEIKNIFRGEEIKANDCDFGKINPKAQKWNNETDKNYIAPDKIITFVCLKKGCSITIKGNVVLGVQLINLNDRETEELSEVEQIGWDGNEAKKSNIVFYGSMACNRLDLIKKLKVFGKTKSNTSLGPYDIPIFLYPSQMATSTPPLAVQIREYMDDYKLTSTSEES